MIVSLPYAEQQEGSAKVSRLGKTVLAYMLPKVDEQTLGRAVERWGTQPMVLGFWYTGQTAPDLSGLPSGKEKLFGVEDFSDSAEGLVEWEPPFELPTWVIQLPDDFTDMRFLERLLKRLPNLRFTGGTLLHLPGFPLGMVPLERYPKRVPVGRVHVFSHGSADVYPILTGDEDWQHIEFVHPKLPTSVKLVRRHLDDVTVNTERTPLRVEKKPNPKGRAKKASSLVTEAELTGLSNF